MSPDPRQTPRPLQALFDPRRRAALGACGAAVLMLAACSKEGTASASASASTSALPTPPQTPPTPPPGQARQAFETAATGAGFELGPALSARVMHVFFDPQCPHCGALWSASQPLADRVRMHWIPVAFINPNSATQGAMLLKAADPVALMTEHEALLMSGQGGVKALGPADEAALASIKANTALWQSLKAGSVPYAVYRAGTDGPYGVQEGQVTTEALTQLLGL